MKWWMLRPLDTWFFRGSMPFNEGEKSSVQPESVFPPPMRTLQGAIRTTLARGQGWTPGNKQPLPPELGDAESLGDLHFTGPILLWQGEALFPAPHLLVGEKPREQPWRLTRLHPGPSVVTDLGRVHLPVPQDPGVKGKALEVWLNRRGLEKVLAGGVPSDADLFPPDRLWEAERRVGLKRDSHRTAKDHHLFMPIHTRPRKELAVAVGVEGIPADWHPRETVISLGGEGRSAAVAVRDGQQTEGIGWPAPPELYAKEGRLFYTVTLTTPASFPAMEEAVRRGLPGLPGCCRSACIGKPEQIGGWDVANKRPRPLQALLPPGSTWWMEAEEKDREKVMAFHGGKIGRMTRYGLGQLVIGTWNGEVAKG
ncbi:type III-B CRISPR module-associated protein Cmr3 [Paludifilum halophilum]|uniref:Type III-B CRISPR module-associated protein Cmr3 n=1 Tax=Paludifilum halophilum TaxID=1642702 RepID=A0A235B2X2_9BACL|nr:type III-B CRISPR module-associated protein Cmr3 [Paludifilum halophilum]OYD06591.1 type III-B CRISPR module-associated protein Cmr3 [Paludifilum halophilum]